MYSLFAPVALSLALGAQCLDGCVCDWTADDVIEPSPVAAGCLTDAVLFAPVAVSLSDCPCLLAANEQVSGEVAQPGLTACIPCPERRFYLTVRVEDSHGTAAEQDVTVIVPCSTHAGVCGVAPQWLSMPALEPEMLQGCMRVVATWIGGDGIDLTEYGRFALRGCGGCREGPRWRDSGRRLRSCLPWVEAGPVVGVPVVMPLVEAGRLLSAGRVSALRERRLQVARSCWPGMVGRGVKAGCVAMPLVAGDVLLAGTHGALVSESVPTLTAYVAGARAFAPVVRVAWQGWIGLALKQNGELLAGIRRVYPVAGLAVGTDGARVLVKRLAAVGSVEVSAMLTDGRLVITKVSFDD